MTPAGPRPRVIVSGPFPPPVHGLAVVNRALADHLSSKAEVVRIDLAGPAAEGRHLVGAVAGRVRHAAAQWPRLRQALRPPGPAVVVIGLSAGAAQWADVLVARQALAAGARVVVHHHSPWPFERPDRLHPFRLAAALWRRCEHLVLCPAMGKALCAATGLPAAAVRVLPNAAWIDGAPPRPAGAGVDTAWRLGFLGQVSEAKGVFRLLDVVDRLVAAGRPVTAEIAGPLAPAIADRFHRQLAARPAVRWLGPLDAAARRDFLHRTDLLLLPTRYRHEAQPLVILEALAHGVPVLATPRGCIGPSLADGDSVQVFAEDSFADDAARHLLQRAHDVPARAAAAGRAVARWQALHGAARRQRDDLVDAWLAGPTAAAAGRSATASGRRNP